MTTCPDNECLPDHREGVIWRCKSCNRPFTPLDEIEQAEEQQLVKLPEPRYDEVYEEGVKWLDGQQLKTPQKRSKLVICTGKVTQMQQRINSKVVAQEERDRYNGYPPLSQRELERVVYAVRFLKIPHLFERMDADSKRHVLNQVINKT